MRPMSVFSAKTNADPDMFTVFENKYYLVRFNGLDGIVNCLSSNTLQKFSYYGNKTVAYEDPFCLPSYLLEAVDRAVD